MASTRNINTPGDYCLQQRSYKTSAAHTTYGGFVNNKDVAIPCYGITPSHMPAQVFSKNPVDIESSLFGINSVNLVSPQPKVEPELKTLRSVAFFETPDVIMPLPLVLDNKQRPFPI